MAQGVDLREVEDAISKLAVSEDHSDEEEAEVLGGDYSGMGSNTLPGSRVQRARKAAAKAYRKRCAARAATAGPAEGDNRDEQVTDETSRVTSEKKKGEPATEPAQHEHQAGLSLGAKIVVVLFLLSLIVPLLNIFISSSPKRR